MKQSPESVASNSTPVWDLPTRLFHWLLVICLPAAWLTYEMGWMEWHGRVGYTVLGLVLFRLGWGLWGSVHARFHDFLRGPASVLAYLRGNLQSGPGHNPLGGWSVVIMLLLMLVQGATGLFNTDEILYDGPLFQLVPSDVANQLGEIHAVLFYVLAGLIGIHVIAVAYYQWGRRQPLINAMISGHKPGVSGSQPVAPIWLALLTLGCSAALVWWLVSLEPAPVVYF